MDMKPTTPISTAVGLCERCARDAIIDDGTDQFHIDHDDHDRPVLRQVGELRANPETFMLAPTVQWIDTAPGFPAMKATADNGCRLCAYVHRSLARRQVDHHGDVLVEATFMWGHRQEGNNTGRYFQSGLVSLRCAVHELHGSKVNRRRKIASVLFLVHVDNRETRPNPYGSYQLNTV